MLKDGPRLGNQAEIGGSIRCYVGGSSKARMQHRSEATNDIPIQYVHRAVVYVERGLTRLEASKGVKSEVYGMYA